ncbi:hypothetical protein [Melittangium boletus]|uniref:hypothetical protein n=1 Tax=Melittangium boletus TaxID=83453 RepID=UPI003DA31F9C
MRWVVLLVAVAMATLGCAHTQVPGRKMYLIVKDASSIDFQEDARGVGGAGAEAYCNELQKQCYTQCMRRKPEIPSIPKHSGKHKEHCTTTCLGEYMNCVKKMEELERQEAQSKKLRFPNITEALDWLKEHTPEAPPGTLVVVAGAGFVIAMVGGALFLVPI